MNTAKKMLLGLLGGAASDSSASFTAVTSGAQTLTIAGLTVSASTTVDWGDGSSNTYTGSGARTHNYAGAGTWTVRILQPLNVTLLDVRDHKAAANSATLAPLSSLTSFYWSGSAATVFNSADVTHWNITGAFGLLVSGGSGVFDSADIAHWRPVSSFEIGGLPVGYSGTINSSDFAGWNPTYRFRVYSLPSGFSGTFDCADIADMRPSNSFYLHSLPVSISLSVGATDFAGYTTTADFQMQGNALSQAQVDAVLLGLNTAGAGRTVAGGAGNLSGTNAAPSGTYAMECPPTTGKGAAFNLLNNSCSTINLGNVWTSWTVTGGL